MAAKRCWCSPECLLARNRAIQRALNLRDRREVGSLVHATEGALPRSVSRQVQALVRRRALTYCFSFASPRTSTRTTSDSILVASRSREP
jgi:hypothetical protein